MFMKFRYPLQSVLRLRQSIERQEEQRLFAIAAVVARLRADIEEFERARLEERRDALREIMSGCPGATLQFAAICDAAAASTHRRLDAQLQEAERHRLEQLSVYQSARQKREIFEGLRQRQEAVYDREVAHREQENADDAFLIRYIGDARESSLPRSPAKPACFSSTPAKPSYPPAD
jgi:flagellar export protein FliJ